MISSLEVDEWPAEALDGLADPTAEDLAALETEADRALSTALSEDNDDYEFNALRMLRIQYPVDVLPREKQQQLEALFGQARERYRDCMLMFPQVNADAIGRLRAIDGGDIRLYAEMQTSRVRGFDEPELKQQLPIALPVLVQLTRRYKQLGRNLLHLEDKEEPNIQTIAECRQEFEKTRQKMIELFRTVPLRMSFFEAHYSQRFAEHPDHPVFRQAHHARVRFFALRQRLADSVFRLGYHWAKRFRWTGMRMEDLVQDAYTGILRATDLYDPRQGAFTTYATWWIRQTLQISTKAHTKNTTPKGRKMVSLDGSTGEAGEFTLLHWLVNGNGTHEKGAEEQKALRAQIVRFLQEKCSPRNREIMELRLGFRDGKMWSLDEIKDYYGLTKERIRQVETQVIEKFAQPTVARTFVPFLPGAKIGAIPLSLDKGGGKPLRRRHRKKRT